MQFKTNMFECLLDKPMEDELLTTSREHIMGLQHIAVVLYSGDIPHRAMIMTDGATSADFNEVYDREVAYIKRSIEDPSKAAEYMKKSLVAGGIVLLARDKETESTYAKFLRFCLNPEGIWVRSDGTPVFEDEEEVGNDSSGSD